MDNVKTDTAPEINVSEFTIVENTWGDKKTKLKNKFSQLNDTDLHFVAGKETELVGRLQSKLSMSAVDVQKIISEI